MASEIKVDTVSEKTSANGVTIDGVNIKDSKIVTANSVDSDVYVDGSIDTAHLAADAITGAKIADDAINSEHYTDGSIDTAHIADAQITIGKLATAVLTGATDIGADIVDADLLLVDDGAGGTLRKTTAARLKTYIGGAQGITGIAQWRMSAGLTGAADPISANLETVDTDGFAILGTDMAVSSGLWTFPTTGMWLVKAHGNIYLSGDSRNQHLAIYTTLNNSSYSKAATGYAFITQTESSTTQGSMEVDFIFDVTNVTNCKVKFVFESVSNSSTILEGQTAVSSTWFSFTRLADT